MLAKGGEGRCAWIISIAQDLVEKTYCVQGSQMLDLLITTRKVASQLRSDLVGQHGCHGRLLMVERLNIKH